MTADNVSIPPDEQEQTPAASAENPSNKAAADQQEQYQLTMAALQKKMRQLDALKDPTAPLPSLLETGIEYIDSAHYEEAFEVLGKALQQEPENAEIVFQMGRLAATCNMHEDARELFYQAGLREPELIKLIVDFYHRQVQNARADER